MYISRLHLRAFGKFIQRKIYFGKNLNIVYGENETGKSTIHNFMELALYGIEDEVERYNKYKPWSSPLYRGTLELEGEGGKFLVSRDFLLDTVQVFKKENDASQSSDYPLEDIDVPGQHFFNINRLTFNNTVNIRQLGNKTEKELSDELKAKIINLSSTKDEDISIDRIMQNLYRIKEEVGSENNDKSLLGQYTLRLSELAKARESSLNSCRQVMFLAMEKKKLQSKIHELNRQIEEKNNEISDYDLSLDKQKFLQAQPIKEEIESINLELKELGPEINSSKEDYKEACETESNIASMKNERGRMAEELEECLSDLERNESDLAVFIPEDFHIEKINIDYDIYKSNNEKLRSLKTKIVAGRESIDSINIDEINKFIDDYKAAEEINHQIEINNVLADSKNYDLMKTFGKKQRLQSFFAGLLGTTFIVGGGASIYGAYYYNNINYYYGGIGFLLGILCYVFSWRKRNIAMSAKKEIESMECEYADYTLSNKDLNEQKHEIIKRNKCEDFYDMADLFQKKSTEKSLYEEKIKLVNYDDNQYSKIQDENNKIENNLKNILTSLNLSLSQDSIVELNEAYKRKDSVKIQIEKLKNKIEEINRDITRTNKEINFEEKRFEMILKANGVEDIETFKKAVDLSERHKVLLNRKEYCENILDNIIGRADYFELEKRTRNVADEVKEIDKQEIQLAIFRLNEEKTKLLNNVDDIHKEILDIEHNTRSLAEIEEEIDFYQEKVSSFKDKIKVAEIAAEKITKISDSIKGDFMPLLRKSISDNFSYLTGDRYQNVDIDEDMNIRVISAQEKDRKIELESLSGGTLDQLYLSLRIALSNILSGNRNIPLILDDSFVQYDSKRLKKSLEMLSRESERRQVILFTCQEREAELSKAMNIKFNYIKL